MEERLVAKIGRLMGTSDFEEPYQQFVENMYPNANYKMVVCFFNVNNNSDNQDNNFSISFDKIDIEDVGANSITYLKYCYRKGSATGGDFTFTTKAGDSEKKLKAAKNICNKFIDKANYNENLSNELNIFTAFKDFLNNDDNSKSLVNSMNNVLKSFDKKEKNIGITFAFNYDNKTFYMSDFETVKLIMLEAGVDGKTVKYDTKSEGFNETCSICLTKKDRLLGFASPFKYYTLDKEIYTSNFFDRRLAWKNYPICTECSVDLENGKTFLYSHLKRSFYGTSYFLIPHTIVDDDNLYRKAITFIKNYAQADKDSKQYVVEDKFMSKIAEENNYFSLDLIFFEENPTTKAINLLLYLEEIFPSRFKTLFVDVPKKVNNNPMFHQCYVEKKERKDLVFIMGHIKHFFGNDFLKIINNIFRGLPLDTKILYHYFMQVIRENYNKMQTEDGYAEPTYLTVYKAIMVYLYLKELGIISTNNGDKTMSNIEISSQQEYKSAFDMQKLNDFIKNNAEFFDKNYKVSIFCLGVLIRAILDIQFRNLNNTPFEKKLRGYNISPSLLKQIYVEALDKLSQYQSFYSYGNLREIIAKNFVADEKEIEKLTNNEISFYLVTGMELGHNFKSNKEEIL